MNRIERVFHPVGQGSFYSEHIYVSDRKYKIVYDCGTIHLSKQKKEVVRQSFSSEDIIDILFISHLDWDHISLITTLIEKVKKIENVVLPHVNDKEPILLSLINCPTKTLLSKVLKFLKSPEEYFGNETKVWRIRSVKENFPGGEEDLNQDVFFLDSKDTTNANGLLNSGKKLSLQGVDFWCYIPFNYYQPFKFMDELKNELCCNKDFEKLFKERLGESCSISVEDALMLLKKPDVLKELFENTSRKNALKKVYNRLPGRINANSLVLYSGPTQKKGNQKRNFYLYKLWQGYPLCCRYHLILRLAYHIFFNDTLCGDIRQRVACIYNGDSNYNENQLKTFLKGLWDNVGTIQVAHHGSKGSHDFNCDGKIGFLCPISHGTKNSYGHPSSEVLRDLLVKNRLPVHITEHQGSEFIEIISCE